MRTYIITVFADYQPSLLSRMLGVFSRRHVEIENLSVHRSASADMCYATFITPTTKPVAERLAAQLEKQIGVLQVELNTYQVTEDPADSELV